ncbi:hypothetical protein Tco_0199458 [Tanacetum coccineum]
MKVVIKCSTTREMWNDLILSHERPSETRDTKIVALRLKFNAFKALEDERVKETYTGQEILLNELENKDVKIAQAEVNVTFVNNLPKKWLSMNQTQRANNSIKNDRLTTLFGKYNYEEELDTRSSNEFLVDLNVEFHDRALLANQNRFYKRSGGVGVVAESFDWDEESLSSEDEGTTTVKAFMAIVEDEPVVEENGENDCADDEDGRMETIYPEVSMLGSIFGGFEKTRGISFDNELIKRVGEGVLAREVPSSFPSSSSSSLR